MKFSRRTTTFLFLPFLLLPVASQASQVSQTSYTSQTSCITFECMSFGALLNSTQLVKDTPEAVDTMADTLWEKFLNDASALSDLKREHEARALKYQDKTMKFSMDKIGEPGENGYPLYIALHGGGTAPAWLNDSQWEHMKIYYKTSVKNGIYVAPRGVTDTWNLHSVDESYPLYDRLIENMVLFEGVDPNRVYIMGFSAGGDGVFQIVPRMPDRFAAANMSAGHYNWLKFDNLYNTPFLMQMGENDAAYNRNRVVVENFIALNNLNEKYDGGYIHELFLHLNGSHNSWRDNDPNGGLGTVIVDAPKWLSENDRTSQKVDTNAVTWVNKYKRNPAPRKLVWDVETNAVRTSGAGQALLGLQPEEHAAQLALPHELFYWLDVSVADTFPAKGHFVAEVKAETNTVDILEATNVDKFRVLLNFDMLDLSRPVRVQVEGQLIDTVTLQANLATMTRTLLERGDKNFIFDAGITLVRNSDLNRWEVVQ